MKRILLLIGLMYLPPIIGMEPAHPFPSAAADIRKRRRISTQIPHMTLISNENNEAFIVPLEMAGLSPVLADMLSNFEEKESKIIPLAIDSATLNTITEIMWSAYNHPDLKGKALLDAISKDIKLNNDQIIPTLLACNFLGFTMSIRLIAQYISLNNNIPLIQQIAQLITSERLSYDTAKEIAKIYWLITSKDFPGVDKDRIGFSVRDYLDYQPQVVKIATQTLPLARKRINDLDGLLEIPDIQNVRTIQLNDNQLTQLPPTIFANLRNLTVLTLGSNQLMQLPANLFENLTNLQYLYLNNNQLTELPANIFANLGNLTHLYLNHNQLTQLQATIFANLGRLQELNLSKNQFTELPATIFANLTNLQELYLEDNQFRELPATIFANLGNLIRLLLSRNGLTLLPDNTFANLGNLRELRLSNNYLTQLPASIFTNLNNLRYISLQNNQFNDEQKKAIRQALPNVRVESN